MNRLFGKGKTKEPPPNLGDCVSNVSINRILIHSFNDYIYILILG